MYDLHTHSDFSDGTLPPEKLIEEAKAKGLTLLALCDHDTAAGLPRARAAARVFGVPFLNGTELEAEYSDQLHILGLGIDPRGKKLSELIDLHRKRRIERNEKLLRMLAEGGMPVYDYLDPGEGIPNKSHIGAALVRAGYCESVRDAFRRFLGRGMPYHVPQEYPSMPEVLEAIHDAGGLSVLAHPMKMKCDHRALIREMKDEGLWGIEAYYSTATPEQTEYFLALAEEFDLRPTCGSDFHGPHRPEAQLGCAWRDVPELRETEDYLKSRFLTDVRRMSFRGTRRTYSIAEFNSAADKVAAELPEEFFKGLNGGVVISPSARQHRLSIPSHPLYILGEYHFGGAEGSYIVLYYGSFVRTKPGLAGQALEEEVCRVMKHEFRHHLEIRAGEHDLEFEDDEYLAEYLSEE